jgi:RAQPRD family integrative conjugative element protein
MYEAFMKVKDIVLIGLILSGVCLKCFANEEQERIYLTQIVNQLNAIKPLITSAAREQHRYNRIQFHYTRYRDSNGKIHNGLLEDINAIENGIREKLDHSTRSQRQFQPLKGDYVINTRDDE